MGHPVGGEAQRCGLDGFRGGVVKRRVADGNGSGGLGSGPAVGGQAPGDIDAGPDFQQPYRQPSA